MSKPCIICDLDRVLFHTNAWEEYIPEDRYSREGWDKFNEQIHLAVPNYSMFGRILKFAECLPIFFITSREARGDMRKITTEQLMAGFNIPFFNFPHTHTLLMRGDGDFRDDDVLKESRLDEYILREGYFPILAIDDNPDVVKMYRSRGILTWQYDIAEPDKEDIK